MKYDVTLVGWCSGSDGLGRHFYAFAEALNSLKVNCALTCPIRQEDHPPEVQKVLKEKEGAPGSVSIFTDLLWLPHTDYPGYKKIPGESRIKLAYTAFESSRVPDEWVKIVHAHFDALIVPDIYCLEVFKESGVTIPIFILPLSLDLHPFLKLPPKKNPHSPFTFGNTSFISERKNHLLLVKAFAKAFGNHPSIQLKLNSKYSEPVTLASLQLWLEEAKIDNIKLCFERLSKEDYIAFIDSLDCYVNVSKGEGFSIPPREALARGIPSILTNNSAQTTLCTTGFFKAVPCPLREAAWYETLFSYHGEYSNSTIDEVARALIDVYENYSMYLKKAQEGKQWVCQYLPENLKKAYLNLVQPQKIVFGDQNEVTDKHLMTSSLILYKKYKLNFPKTNKTSNYI